MPMSEAPKLIHQTWKTEEVPEEWQEAQKAWQDFAQEHGYVYQLWTDEAIEEFIKEEYPWMMDYYEALPLGIQRSHVFRYVLMYHHGGIFADLDVKPKPTMHLMLASLTQHYPVILSKEQHANGRNYLSTGFMMSAPKHDFWNLTMRDVVQHEPSMWDKAWTNTFKHYDVIMRTGSRFLSTMYETHADPEEVFVLPRTWLRPMREERSPFVEIAAGGPTWRDWDSKMVEYGQSGWNHREWALLAVVCIMILVVVLLSLFR